jgi:hypothetical protein
MANQFGCTRLAHENRSYPLLNPLPDQLLIVSPLQRIGEGSDSPDPFAFFRSLIVGNFVFAPAGWSFREPVKNSPLSLLERTALFRQLVKVRADCVFSSRVRGLS